MKKQNQIENFRSRILKDGKQHFYIGRKKANEKQVKEIIKLNYQILDPEKLKAKERQYLGAVKGGKKRAENSLSNSKGQFLPKDIEIKALKELGINLKALMEAKGAKNIREAFKGNKKLQKSFDKLIDETGLELFYNEDKALEKLTNFNGNKIFINGLDVDKQTAINKLTDFIGRLKRKFDLYYPGVSVRFLYKGFNNKKLSELRFALEESIFADGENTDNVQLYHSNKDEGAKKRNKKNPYDANEEKKYIRPKKKNK